MSCERVVCRRVYVRVGEWVRGWVCGVLVAKAKATTLACIATPFTCW
jgi:hypothetical protein